MAATSVSEHENAARETVRMKDRQKRKVDWVHVREIKRPLLCQFSSTSWKIT